MLNRSRTRALPTFLAAACVACLAMMAGYVLAFAEPTSSASQAEPKDQASQPNTDQQQPAQDQSATQSNQSPDLNAQPNTDQSERAAQPKSGENSNRAESSRKSQPSDSQQSGSRFSAPNPPSSDDTSRNLQSRTQQGASLGVNITPSRSGSLVITRVTPGTPAEQMGLRPRDRIQLINGNAVGGVDEFISQIRSMNPGDQVELQIVRDGNEQSFRGQLEPFGQALARSPQIGSNDEYQNYRSVIGGRPDSQNPNIGDSRDAQRTAEPGATLQASYEDRGPSSTAPPTDLDARLRRIEEHLDRLTQDVQELHNLVGSPAPSSGLREAASAELRATGPQTQLRTRPNTPQQNGEVLKRNDRWNTENRFEQADLPGARERATAEAARRRAQQTGAQLQQQEQQRAANTQQGTQPNQPNANSESPPQPTDQPETK